MQRRWAGSASGRSDVRRLLALRHQAAERATAGARSWPPPTPAPALILDAYGGAINRPDRDDTAFPHRDARFSVQVLSYTNIPTARARVGAPAR